MCDETACKVKYPRYGFAGMKPRRCAGHKLPGMVNLAVYKLTGDGTPFFDYLDDPLIGEIIAWLDVDAKVALTQVSRRWRAFIGSIRFDGATMAQVMNFRPRNISIIGYKYDSVVLQKLARKRGYKIHGGALIGACEAGNMERAIFWRKKPINKNDITEAAEAAALAGHTEIIKVIFPDNWIMKACLRPRLINVLRTLSERDDEAKIANVVEYIRNEPDGLHSIFCGLCCGPNPQRAAPYIPASENYVAGALIYNITEVNIVAIEWIFNNAARKSISIEQAIKQLPKREFDPALLPRPWFHANFISANHIAHLYFAIKHGDLQIAAGRYEVAKYSFSPEIPKNLAAIASIFENQKIYNYFASYVLI